MPGKRRHRGYQIQDAKSPRKLAKTLRFTENQATAILEMRLYKLIGLEIEALMKEHEATLANIDRYQDILNNYKSMATGHHQRAGCREKRVRRSEKNRLLRMRRRPFSRRKRWRRWKWSSSWTVSVMREPWILSVYERNKEAADAENKYVLSVMNTDKISILTDSGRQHLIKVLDLPYGKFRDKGKPIDNLCNYDSTQEQAVAVESLQKLQICRCSCLQRKRVCSSRWRVPSSMWRNGPSRPPSCMDDDELISVETSGRVRADRASDSPGHFSYVSP